MVCGLHKLEFKTCLDSWSTWRLALDSVKQSQSSCVIIGLGQERYAEKPIINIPLCVSISSIIFYCWVEESEIDFLYYFIGLYVKVRNEMLGHGCIIN